MKTILHISWLLLRVIKSTSTSIPSHQSTLSLPQCVLIPFPPSLTLLKHLFLTTTFTQFSLAVLLSSQLLMSFHLLIPWSVTFLFPIPMFTPNLLSSILPKPWALITLGQKFLNSVLLLFTCQFTICFLSLCPISA